MELLETYAIEIDFRPTFPLAIRDPDFFRPDNIKRAKYILLDWPRRAEMLGMPNHWPSPDPVVQDLKDFTISADQPYIYRLVYLGVEAQRRGYGIQFAAEVSRLLFGGTKDWHLGDHLKEAAGRAGLDLDEMEKAIEHPESHHEEVEQNQQALEECGHWSVPTFVFEKEPFFGQDRIDSLRWRLEQQRVPHRD